MAVVCFMKKSENFGMHDKRVLETNAFRAEIIIASMTEPLLIHANKLPNR